MNLQLIRPVPTANYRAVWGVLFFLAFFEFPEPTVTTYPVEKAAEDGRF